MSTCFIISNSMHASVFTVQEIGSASYGTINLHFVLQVDVVRLACMSLD